jgi:hypothetical protein
MFVRAKGKTKKMWYSVTPSTVILKGALVTLSSGKLICATNTMTNKEIIGVWAGPTIAATDADYALDRLGPVEVPVEKNVTWTAALLSAPSLRPQSDCTLTSRPPTLATPSIKAQVH